MSAILDRFGVVPDDTEQFAGFVVGRTLILDGDSDCYNVTMKCAKLETAQRRFKTRVYEHMFIAQAESCRVHLTPKGCAKNGRHLLLGAKPYQGQRTGPKPAQLEPLRASAHTIFDHEDNVEVFAHYDIEADDGVMIDAYSIPNCIVKSEDKDLNIVPCARICNTTGKILTLPKGDRFGWLGTRYTEAGKAKPDGHGTKFFWLQMLMGDTADNVKGILRFDGALCGETIAPRILNPVTCENHAANLVINGYRAINQNPLPEAEALWLLRARGDSAVGYIWSLDLTPANRAFIQDCFNRKYKMTQEEYAEKDCT